jgi:prevent-host-death family protein
MSSRVVKGLRFLKEVRTIFRMESRERSIGVEAARAQLGKLLDEVNASGEPITIVKYGHAHGVLISRDEYARLKLAAGRLAREEIADRLAETRKRVAEAGIDPTDVDEAIAQVRKLR